jgi:hypothetical protein
LEVDVIFENSMRWAKMVLLAGALASFTACKDDDSGDAGASDVPNGKAGEVNEELAADFKSDTRGGLTSIEKFALGTEKSSESISQLSSMSASASLLVVDEEEKEGDDEEKCKSKKEGKDTDADSDGFKKDLKITFDCSFEHEGMYYRRSGSIVNTDEDDDKALSGGTVEYQNLKYESVIKVATYEITTSYNSNGHFKRSVDGDTRTVDLAFYVKYEVSGLPEAAQEQMSNFAFPSFHYNFTSTQDAKKNELEIKGFYRVKGVNIDSDNKQKPYDYTLEITTEEPLVIAEACTSKGTFGGGKVSYEAGSGKIEVSYDKDCNRTVKFDGKEI